jgi:UDP-N-acetylmuramoyl-L-alanyl-D-glutamate--2,6-diaminopimelate ligase
MAQANHAKTVRLHTLLAGFIDQAVLADVADIDINQLVQDNRNAGEGDLFLASQGFNTHGLLYAQDAVAKGVRVVLWDGDCERRDEILDSISNKVVCIQCPDLKHKMGEIASRYYGEPSAGMNMIGITGTDGKTSIAHYLAQALDENAVHCGVLGTLGNGFINDLHPTGLTTPDALQIQQTLAMMRDAGAQHAVMEVSSHGLDQGRVNGVAFKIAVFSNLAQDHLDYHQTIDRYAEAKRRLFHMPGLQAAVINLDDAFGRVLAAECKGRLCVWGYSTRADVSELEQYADFIVHTRSIEAIENGMHLNLVTPKGSCSCETGLLGHFNVSNILAVLASLLLSHIQFEDAIARLRKIVPVSGRMQIASTDGKPVVVVDYAHTPQALAAACAAVRDHIGGELWCVFGCGGDRDRDKRPKMARVVEQYADHVIVTSDNPRHEPQQQIIDDIMPGFTQPQKVQQIIDRQEAIKSAISQAKPGDAVLLAGKGHECSQLIGDVHIAFDDMRIARDYLGVGA